MTRSAATIVMLGEGRASTPCLCDIGKPWMARGAPHAFACHDGGESADRPVCAAHTSRCSKPLQHDLSNRRALLHRLMRPLEVCGIDRAVMLAARGAQNAAVNQARDEFENRLLLDHVGGVENRAREHRLPV